MMIEHSETRIVPGICGSSNIRKSINIFVIILIKISIELFEELDKLIRNSLSEPRMTKTVFKEKN